MSLHRPLLAAAGFATLALCVTAGPSHRNTRGGDSAHPSAARAAPSPEAIELAGKFSAAELRERLGQFYTLFVNAMEGATARAAAGEHNVEQRERLTLVKIRAARACRNAVFQNDPLSGYIDTLALCVQFRALTATPDAAALLGTDLPEFIAVTARLDTEITALGEHFLAPGVIESLHLKLEEFAKKNPLGTSHSIVPPSANFDANLPELGWLLDLPLAPFRALQGVDHTAQAVSGLGTVADGFSRTLAYLPLELAWESQLLVLQTRREAEAAGRALIDHAALRAAQLLAGLFAAALLWRLIPSRRPPAS